MDCHDAGKELTERLTIPKTIEGWDDLSIEERYQREINYIRVRRQIAPYLATDHDRFFGAFIVSILNPENVEFEPLSDLIEKVPRMYKQAGRVFGFLHLAGDEVLVPLDGQHRLAALEFAITGKDQQQRTIKAFEPNVDVASDDCTVLLMKHDPVKSRKIFNKVNRYAKKTTKAENLIAADDDVGRLLGSACSAAVRRIPGSAPRWRGRSRRGWRWPSRVVSGAWGFRGRASCPRLR